MTSLVPSSLVFQSTQLDILDHNNQIWIQSRQLAQALGYADEKSVTKIYERNKDEFSNDMTDVVKLSTRGQIDPGVQDVNVRIFSLRGCHLVGMFARTKVAKEFRGWVLDVLEDLANKNTIQRADALRLSTPQEREPLRKLCGVWARIARLHYPDCYTQVAGHFNLDTITTIPVSWIPDALAFVQGRIDEAQRISLEGAARWELPPSKDSAITEEMVMGVLAAISARGAQFPQLEKQSRRKPSDPVIQSTMSLLYEAAKATQSILEVLTRLDASKEQMIRAVESMVRRVSRTFVETSDLGA